ncbi:MAG: hypothetical protein IH585_01760 [Anaerolineaceae bacterium]|nr:hypothetical protein [Anaerolineaceae bacterium]
MNLNKKQIRIFSLPILILLISSACSLPWVSKSSENMVASTPPVVKIQDLSPFQNIGCVWQTDNYAVCNQDSIPKKMGCDALITPPEYMNYINTESQFVSCTYASQLQTPPDETEAKGLYDSGCSINVKQRILVYQDGDYLLIRDLEDLKYNFAPITTAEQALGYAIAATGSEGRYDLENLKGYRILTDNLHETTVQSVEGGFEVVLFRYLACGCGPHTTFMQTIKVTTAGDIDFVGSTSAFENPEEDDLCVD